MAPLADVADRGIDLKKLSYKRVNGRFLLPAYPLTPTLARLRFLTVRRRCSASESG
jgi:hypothetical protein